MDGTSSCREIRTSVDVNDMTIDELRARAERTGNSFAVALVERIDRQERTIRELFADVVRLSIGDSR